MAEYKAEFDKYDNNGDGFIDAKEFRSILETMASSAGDPNLHAPSETEIEEIFKSNADICQNNRMDYDAFCKMISMVKDVDDEIRQQFNHFDVNGDGKISKKELKKGLKGRARQVLIRSAKIPCVKVASKRYHSFLYQDFPIKIFT